MFKLNSRRRRRSRRSLTCEVLEKRNLLAGELVELLLTARDLSDNQIAPNEQTGRIEVNANEEFLLEVSYNDLRTFDQLGLFAIFTDITPSSGGILKPVLTETQGLLFRPEIQNATSGDLVFSLENSATTYTSSFGAFDSNAQQEVVNALTAFGYAPDEFAVTALDFGTSDVAFRIRYTDADQAGNIDLPDISVTANLDVPVDVTFEEFAPFNADGSVNSDAVRFNLDTRSRTFNSNEEFYNLLNRGGFDELSGFFDVGGVGQVPTQGGGIPQLSNDGTLTEPFDAFSLRVFFDSGVTGFEVGVSPSDNDEAILLYGRNEPVPSDLVLVDNLIFDVAENRSPVVSGPISATFIEDDAPASVDLLTGASDPDGDPLSISAVTVTSGNPDGIAVNNTTLTVTPAAYEALNTGESEVITLSYDVVDGKGGAVAQTATITINGVTDVINQPPVAVDDVFDTDEDEISIFVVLANDLDPDNDPLTIVDVTEPTNGEAVINPEGTITYTPDPDFNGTDAFNYTIGDGNGGSDTAVVDVTVNSVNDPPTFDNAGPVTVSEDSGPYSEIWATNILPGPNDEVDQSVLFEVAVPPGSEGLFQVLPEISASGVLMFTPASGAFGSVDTTVIAVDSAGGQSAPTVLPITITADVDEGTTGKITGGGSIDERIRNFGFNVQGKAKDGELSYKGNVQFHDKDHDLNLHSSEITSVSIESDGVSATAKGTATVNRVGRYEFTILIEDNGEPGAGVDRFRIQILGPGGFSYDSQDFASAAGLLDKGGNIQVHQDSGNEVSVLYDFGDAPESYGTTLDSGARHGIVEGLNLGALIDNESDGQPTVGADGDDTDAGGDDEDGVRLLSPLAVGSTASIEVQATNLTSEVAYIQGFLDLDRDGSFSPSEQLVSDLPVPAGTLDGTFIVDVSIPGSVAPGDIYGRFRLSQTSGIQSTGSAATGEVEDYLFQIVPGQLANDDEFSVSRNSLANPLDVLANDFQTTGNPLTILSLNVSQAVGIVVISADRKSLFYTPANGFIGKDVFRYSVIDQFGNRSDANVTVNVLFQANSPIAVDDIFEVPEGSTDRNLDVLTNDIPSISGGLQIVNVSPGSAGGNLVISAGGQSIRYTPQPGFAGTEQFTYRVSDAVGLISEATVTINLLPGSRADDVVEFSLGLFDPVNTSLPISSVQVGDDVLLRVFVDDLRIFANPEGVASAFLDVLYDDGIVSTVNTDSNSSVPYDISFGPLFSGVEGDVLTPGLINEVGGFQNATNPSPHAGPVELLTVKIRAVSPGTAVFRADPADETNSVTALLGSDETLSPAQLRLGRTELQVFPSSSGGNATAIDDSFPAGLDSDGNLINGLLANRLDVLSNDNFGPTGAIREFGLVTSPSLGNVLIDDNGTPSNLNDDFFSYRANQNSNGLERFTYLIVTDDNIRSTAEVTIALGNSNANADVALDFALVSGDGSGSSISSVSVGQRFGVQIIVDDVRANSTAAVAAFLDLMYDSNIVTPSNLDQADAFDFDVEFGPDFVEVSGTADATLSAPTVGQIETQSTVDTTWHNADFPTDVNSDGFTSPIDAAVLMNFIVSAGTLPTPPPAGQAPPPFYDVDANGMITALDLLLVVNFLAQSPTIVPTAARPGIIDELGSFRTFTDNGSDPALLATVYFDAIAVGGAKFVGGPADSFPFSDTLIFQRNDPLESEAIRFDTLTIAVTPNI